MTVRFACVVVEGRVVRLSKLVEDLVFLDD